MDHHLELVQHLHSDCFLDMEVDDKIEAWFPGGKHDE